MDLCKRACLVAPDRWVGSVAQGIRLQYPSLEIVCVAEDAAAKACLNLRVATTAADSLASGLRGCDLILVGHRDVSPEIGYRRVITACEKNATIVGHNRSITEVSELIRTLNRADVHYMSLEIRNSPADDSDVSLANVADLSQQVVALSPASVEDLDGFFRLQECLLVMGAQVIGMSPRVHDNALAKFVHLPKAILIPIVSYLAESAQGDKPVLMPAIEELLPLLTGFTPQKAEAWARELSGNKDYLLHAIESYKQHVAALEKDVTEDHLQESMHSLLSQLADLSVEAQPKPAPKIAEPPVFVSPTPESLVKTVDSLLAAVDQIEAHETDSKVTPGIQAVRKLVEQTHEELERLYNVNVVVQAAQAVAATVPQSKPKVEEEPESGLGSSPIADNPVPPKPETWHSAERPTYSAPIAPQSFHAQPDSAEDVAVLEAPAAAVPEVDAPQPTVHVEPPMQMRSIEMPGDVLQMVAETNEAASEAFSQADPVCDVVVYDKPEIQVKQRTQRLLTGARIPVRALKEFTGQDGKKLLGIVLVNSMQRESARALLRQAGIPLE